MVRLRLLGMQDSEAVTLGPAPGFRVAGNFLWQLPGNHVVAEYSRHQWHAKGGHFSRYDCIDRCKVHFESTEGTPSEIFGPFEVLHVADGTMYADDKLFAKFIDETLLWNAFEIGTHWPSLIITPGDGA